MPNRNLSALLLAPDLLLPQIKPTFPVEVDWSKPLASDLINCIVFDGGHPFDLVQRKFLDKTGTAHFDTIRAGGLGHRYGNTGGTESYTVEVPTIAGSTSPYTVSKFSIAWMGERHNSGTEIGLRDNTGAGGTILLWHNSGYDMRIGGTDFTAAGTWPADEPVRIVASVSAAACKLFANGDLVINGGAPGGTAIVAPWQLHKNGNNAQGGVFTDYILCIWARPLNSEEAYVWMADPYWSVLRPAPSAWVRHVIPPAQNAPEVLRVLQQAPLVWERWNTWMN